jgi:hypothetical protein
VTLTAYKSLREYNVDLPVGDSTYRNEALFIFGMDNVSNNRRIAIKQLLYFFNRYAFRAFRIIPMAPIEFHHDCQSIYSCISFCISRGNPSPASRLRTVRAFGVLQNRTPRQHSLKLLNLLRAKGLRALA